MFSKKSTLLMVIGIISILIIGCSSPGNNSSNNDIAATVNGANIYMDDFQAAVDRTVMQYSQQGFDFEGEEGEEALAQLRNQVINSLIQEELLVQESSQMDYEVTQEMVDEELSEFKLQFSTDEEYQSVLDSNGITEDEVVEMIRDQIKIDEFIRSEIEESEVTESELADMYEQFKLFYADSGEEVPSFEEVRSDLEAQIKQQNEQEQVGILLEELMENSDVEIFVL